ncbi:MAG: hypothetical protein IT434_05630 [Phycisphaerales bacterium]|jgi:hypothetical protein|nr:hypothetical protein [Phycisphaerales bacterium]
MKKLARAKSIARWTAWVLAVLLPAMWVASVFFVFLARTPARADARFVAVFVGDGCVGFAYITDPSKVGRTIRPVDVRRSSVINPLAMVLPDILKTPASTQVVLPLWIPWLIALGFSAWFLRDHRREKMRRMIGRCPACGYDRSGLPQSAPCPECAAPATHR